eukprot:scaffold630_cov399-Prasinococcus_capsulatus_cf.AAC.25
MSSPGILHVIGTNRQEPHSAAFQRQPLQGNAANSKTDLSLSCIKAVMAMSGQVLHFYPCLGCYKNMGPNYVPVMRSMSDSNTTVTLRT